MHGASYFILTFPGALPSYILSLHMDDTTIMDRVGKSGEHGEHGDGEHAPGTLKVFPRNTQGKKLC